MWVDVGDFTDDQTMSAYRFNEIADSLMFARFRKIWVPTGIGDDSVIQFGQVTIDTATAATATAAVTFPTTMPTSTPTILHQPVNTTIYGSTHESVSSTGFTMRVRAFNDLVLDVNIPVNWWALDKSATGGGTSWTAPRRWSAEAVTDTLLDSEWSDKFAWLKKQLLEVTRAADENKMYRHGYVRFDGSGASFSEQVTFDQAFATPPNVLAQTTVSTVYQAFALAVSSTGLTLAIRHHTDTSLSVKQLLTFWIGAG